MSSVDTVSLNKALDHHPIPLGDNGPVFEEPWQAQAFAMTVHLNETGVFTWSQWAEQFSIVIARNEANKAGKSYYENWLEALEFMVAEAGGITADQLARENEAWREAAERTPHGEPIELQRMIHTNRSD